MPWPAVEAMHWQMGADEMARRIGTKPISISSHMPHSNAVLGDDPHRRPTAESIHWQKRRYEMAGASGLYPGLSDAVSRGDRLPALATLNLLNFRPGR